MIDIKPLIDQTQTRHAVMPIDKLFAILLAERGR